MSFTAAIAISGDGRLVVYNDHIHNMKKMFDIPWIEIKHQSTCSCIVESNLGGGSAKL